MSTFFKVPRLQEGGYIKTTVPGSKSITNRALLLAALSQGRCRLEGVLFSQDTRAMLECLAVLGFLVESDEENKTVLITGTGGKIPNKKAHLHVRSAGTAARFLTVLLAFAGGKYTLDADMQMKKRPMEELLSVLRKMGVKITCSEREGHFPFQIQSDGISAREVTINTDTSSQFASALLMAGRILPGGLRVCLTGQRVHGSYIAMTLRIMEQFGVWVEPAGEEDNFDNAVVYQVLPGSYGRVEEYRIEPDVSAACYFYAMAPLLKAEVLVHGVRQDTLQGDIKFLSLLEKMGCIIKETAEGIWLSGKMLDKYPGVTVDMKDFSDQTMTLAAIAPFADSITEIKNVGHIRVQESDRMKAIITELAKLGIRCRMTEDGDGMVIYPGEIHGGKVETYEDHRMAMAFTLIGLKTGVITINNPQCCRKTFENYFAIITDLGNQLGKEEDVTIVWNKKKEHF